MIIEQSIEQASVYKGNNVPDNAYYISQKLNFGSWAVLVANPAANYGGFACNIKQYAKLGNYGIYKWTYLIMRMSWFDKINKNKIIFNQKPIIMHVLVWFSIVSVPKFLNFLF